MIFPKGELKYHNLLTSYTDFPALLSTLKAEAFSGIIEIEFPENKGAILIDVGKIINAEARMGNDSDSIIGQEGVETLLGLSKQKDGVINVYQLPPEQVALVASHLQNEILFKELSTDFTRFDGLLLKLRGEKHNGFIEVFSKENQPLGVLFLKEGEPVDMFTTSESGPFIFGPKSIPIFVENAVQHGAIFNVYRSQRKVSKGETSGQEKTEEKKGIGGLSEIILIFQEVLSDVEKWVDAASQQKGTFFRIFKKSLIEKSGTFPFLDPFAMEFEYREGIIQFSGDVEINDFAKGILECLSVTLTHLEEELPKKRMLAFTWRKEIKSVLERHQAMLMRFGIDIEALQ